MSQEVNILPINIYQGGTWTRTMTVRDQNRVAKNLSGYTGKMQIREKAGGVLYKDLNTTDGGMTINEAYGEIELSLTADETAAFTFRNASYDIFIYSSAGTATPLLKGRVIVEQRITQ